MTNVELWMKGCTRIAKELGYERILTYILASEQGTSLKASNWTLDAESAGGGGWNVPSRPRVVEEEDLFGNRTKYPTEKKQRWVCKLNRRDI